MKNITMTTNAGVCVVSVRPRPAGQVLLAPIGVRGQGTTVSSVRYLGLGHIGFGAPFQGDASVVATTPKTFDVARSRLGRPPV